MDGGAGGGEASAPLVLLRLAWTIQGLGVGPSFSRCRSPCARSFIWASMQGSNPRAGGMMVYIVYCSERFLRGTRAFKKLPEPPVMFRGRKEQAPPPISNHQRSRCPARITLRVPCWSRGGARLVADPRVRGGEEPPRVLARNFTAAPPHSSNGEGYQAVGGGGSSKRCRAQRQAYCPPAKGIPPPPHPHLTFGAQGRSSGPRCEARWRLQFPRRRRRSGASFPGRTSASVADDEGREALSAGLSSVRGCWRPRGALQLF
ncbi:hypothetical protein NDU88_002110 [Pleurodeles waltl]|uniref:Uncharacterized protein n=1 Tax=Pleurodeles waltl TaxID=8319 RepID=A0AAV7UXZ5_PLEWA|nr:hypothetical protein NDU88_002110 [Pleurodeles waltl]